MTFIVAFVAVYFCYNSYKSLSVKLLIFSYPSVLTYVFGAQKICLIEAVFEYPQHMFWLRNKKKHFGKGLYIHPRSDATELTKDS